MADPFLMVVIAETLESLAKTIRQHYENAQAPAVSTGPATIQDTGKLPGAKKAVRRTRKPKEDKKLKASDVMRGEDDDDLDTAPNGAKGLDDDDDDDSLDV